MLNILLHQILPLLHDLNEVIYRNSMLNQSELGLHLPVQGTVFACVLLAGVPGMLFFNGYTTHTHTQKKI